MTTQNIKLNLNTAKFCAAAGTLALACKAKDVTLSISKMIPSLFADLIGPMIGGAYYYWIAKPIAVVAHNIIKEHTDLPNATYNALTTLPLGKEIIAMPRVAKAIHPIMNLADKTTNYFTNKIPQYILSKQSIQITKNHVKNQFIHYLQMVCIYKLTSKFSKIDQGKPSLIMTMLHPANLIFLGVTLMISRLMASAQDSAAATTSLKPCIQLPTTNPSLAEKQIPTGIQPSQVLPNKQRIEALAKGLQEARFQRTLCKPQSSWQKLFCCTKSQSRPA